MKKTVVILILTSFIAVLLISSTSFLYHQIQRKKEAKRLIPPGQMVTVYGQNLHVYTEGDGKETLVFLSGGGTNSPMLDFKPLYSLLRDTYQIAVVEKAGYGFSDVTDSSRDIDTILSETREALKQSGMNGPYILVPHSMSGLEALYWAKQFPEEVKAIIGLDMAVPEAYARLDISMPLIHLGAFAAHAGFTRWVPGLTNHDTIHFSTLTDDEQETYQLLKHHRTSTKNMVKEVQAVKENAEKVKSAGIPDLPVLLFVSNGKETGFEPEEWLEIQETFYGKLINGEYIRLDAPHYIHHREYEQIAEESRKFLEQLDETDFE